MGSVHIEVPDYYTADRLDNLEREIVQKVMDETGVILTGVSVYSVNTTNDEAAQIREDIRRRVMIKEHVLQMHGFYMTENTIQFDVVIGFEAPDRHAVWQQIVDELQERYPAYRLSVTLDNDMSD